MTVIPHDFFGGLVRLEDGTQMLAIGHKNADEALLVSLESPTSLDDVVEYLRAYSLTS